VDDEFLEDCSSQAAVDVDSLLIVAATLTQDASDNQQVESMLDEQANLTPCRPIMATSAKAASTKPAKAAS
jgi:hypothetical protein